MIKSGIAILLSGRGSHLSNFILECDDPLYPAKIECVISDNSKAAGVKIAQQANIPTFIIEKSNYTLQLNNILNDFNIKVICLAGFMNILPSSFIQLWTNKIINIHPSLLPSFKGLHAQTQAIKAGVKIAGCTVHFVDNGIDTGKIIMQSAINVSDDDNAQSLSAKILIAEHQCYPKALAMFLK